MHLNVSSATLRPFLDFRVITFFGLDVCICVICVCIIICFDNGLLPYWRQALYAPMMVHSLQWHHNEHPGVSNRRRLAYLYCRLCRLTSKKHQLVLCEDNPPMTGGFPSQRVNNTATAFIGWRHHELAITHRMIFSATTFKLKFCARVFIFCTIPIILILRVIS